MQTVYAIIMQNGYGNKAIHSLWTTNESACDEILRLVRNQERYDNDYHIQAFELKGDILGLINNNLILNKYHDTVKENESLAEQLKLVAKNLKSLMPEQPTQCVFGYGCCGYPIDDCYNCPCHPWSDYGMPLTTCEFK